MCSLAFPPRLQCFPTAELLYHTVDSIGTMLLNSREALSTDKVLLVPYCEHHVPRYHEWMQDAELREATASEELTIDEEYAMQKSWRMDHDKLTFIVCAPLAANSNIRGSTIRAGQADNATQMIGDINLFLYDESDDDEGTDAQQLPRVVGEIELMIAGRQSRRQGYGRAALVAFLNYITVHQTDILKEHSKSRTAGAPHPTVIAYLRVKINQDNVASIALFQSIGFSLVSPTANYFGELELRTSLYTHFTPFNTTEAQYRLLAYEHNADD